MFVGEAPGKQEDLGAEPFIGAAGQYLNSLLALAGLKREEIYIANVLKCRPPENRDPRPEEIEVCTPFLRDQVRIIDPEILVTLGNFATRFILKTDRGITGLRGQVYITGRFSVLPIFHPAAAIYDRNKESIMEEDFRLLGRLITKRREERAARAVDADAGSSGTGGTGGEGSGTGDSDGEGSGTGGSGGEGSGTGGSGTGGSDGEGFNAEGIGTEGSGTGGSESVKASG
jgi:DNA polymerase